MFTRRRRVGRHDYIEALSSYRDPETGRPKHRCIARWPAERSLAEELGRTRWRVERDTESLAYWQGVIDRTVRPKFRKHYRRAPEAAARSRRDLAKASAHFSALSEACQGLGADEAEIERARRASAEEWNRMTASFRAALSPRPAGDRGQLSTLADRVRSLKAQNDPDALRAGLEEVATALDSLSQG